VESEVEVIFIYDMRSELQDIVCMKPSKFFEESPVFARIMRYPSKSQQLQTMILPLQNSRNGIFLGQSDNSRLYT
jgi:hypothetical protein